MQKIVLALAVIFLVSSGVCAQQASQPQDTLSAEEQAVVAAILAKNAAAPDTPPSTEQQAEPSDEPNAPTDQDETTVAKGTCPTIAFIDIDVAFNEHPRAVAVREQIRLKILAKEQEVQSARQLIDILNQENQQLAAQLRELKPFYERIVVETQPLLPRVEEPADTLLLNNLLNRLTFSRTEILSTSPLDTPARLEDITARMAANKKIIAQHSFFIDNYKYTTREEILTLEKKEVNEILQDIYREIKSFARKRNIGVIVRKDEILYGEKPVNVTKDFVNRLKKSKKYHKYGK